MVGIRSFGGYIPKTRLARDEIAKAWGSGSMGGEKAVCNHDEDSLTMAVEAGINCIEGIDPKTVDGVYFASTTPPYKEKQSSTLIATVLDLGRETITADFTDSLKAGTTALRAAMDAVKSGSAKNVVVTTADARPAEPESMFEQTFGDGAAALLISDQDVIATIEETYSIADEIVGLYRRDSDNYVRQFSTKFNSQFGYSANMVEAVSGLLKKSGAQPGDITRACLYAPDPRSLLGVAKELKLDAKTQLQDPLFLGVGDTGTPLSLMMLVNALEKSRAGDTILVASYGDGSDAMLFKVTDNIETISHRRGIDAYLKNKMSIGNYEKYVRYRNLMQKDKGTPFSSATLLWRERKQNLSLYGVKCGNCGQAQYPMNRVCLKCGKRDKMEELKMARKGKVFTFTLDYLASGPELPVPRTVIDLEEGGRIFLQMTDCDPQIVKIDTPVELTFRKIHEGGGFKNYYWKSRPVMG